MQKFQRFNKSELQTLDLEKAWERAQKAMKKDKGNDDDDEDD